MQSVVVALIALFALPLAYNASSSTTADISTHCSDQFYDINMEILVSGEITSKPRIILKVGGSGSLDFPLTKTTTLLLFKLGLKLSQARSSFPLHSILHTKLEVKLEKLILG